MKLRQFDILRGLKKEYVNMRSMGTNCSVAEIAEALEGSSEGMNQK